MLQPRVAELERCDGHVPLRRFDDSISVEEYSTDLLRRKGTFADVSACPKLNLKVGFDIYQTNTFCNLKTIS